MILQDKDTNQTVKFVSRNLASGSGTVTFWDEETNESYGYEVALLTDTYYTYFTNALPDLVEEHDYLMIVENGTDEIYRTKVFVTNQLSNIDDVYSVNNNQYTERTTENKYLVYE